MTQLDARMCEHVGNRRASSSASTVAGFAFLVLTSFVWSPFQVLYTVCRERWYIHYKPVTLGHEDKEFPSSSLRGCLPMVHAVTKECKAACMCQAYSASSLRLCPWELEKRPPPSDCAHRSLRRGLPSHTSPPTPFCSSQENNPKSYVPCK